jgi:NAD(P)-dependent dehydrogenase (short-subunit alcohol dehydrogenase family)
MTPEAFALSFAINATGPALIAKHFLGLLARNEKAVFAAISARVGSVSDNRLGGWHAYRAAKAALNMLLRNFAIEQAARNRTASIVGLHPGTVDTGLSKPFQSGVGEGRLFSPQQSAGYMLNVIDKVTPTRSGQLLAWDGSPIPF